MALPLPQPIHTGKMAFEEFIHWGDETSFAEWIDGEYGYQTCLWLYGNKQKFIRDMTTL